jgi:hypothetical protein
LLRLTFRRNSSRNANWAGLILTFACSRLKTLLAELGLSAGDGVCWVAYDRVHGSSQNPGAQGSPGANQALRRRGLLNHDQINRWMLILEVTIVLLFVMDLVILVLGLKGH